MKSEPAKTKAELRKHFRDIRSRMPILYRQDAALNAAALFSRQSFFEQSKHIACYLAVKNEFECLPLIKTIWEAKKNCYLPILTAENTLQFVRYHEGDPLQLNRYSIPEPVTISNFISPENLDCVLLPLVAFDKQGHRLGTGGGYYDRTFAFLKAAVTKKPTMIGVAYAAQQADFVPVDSWDIAIDGVITEKSYIITCTCSQ